jgi:hypothetical protein
MSQVIFQWLGLMPGLEPGIQAFALRVVLGCAGQARA